MTGVERKKYELFILQQVESQGLFKDELDYQGMKAEKLAELKLLERLGLTELGEKSEKVKETPVEECNGTQQESDESQESLTFFDLKRIWREAKKLFSWR